ncbi:MAG: hypothetical protein J6X23_02000, partial [Bacteroidaceae bacterium]|nr:hypothetical protein [Bacteroidaceae bacterium]
MAEGFLYTIPSRTLLPSLQVQLVAELYIIEKELLLMQSDLSIINKSIYLKGLAQTTAIDVHTT